MSQDLVREFHEKYNYPVDEPLTLENRLFRVRLIAEEFAELIKALEMGDLIEVADALADLNYVVNGTAVTFGFPLDALTAEVHRSNMTKDFDRHVGKPVKGLNYSKPKILETLSVARCRRLEEV